ncbi:MAG: hypothetical protein H0V70_14575 [Ktedonobacteraceae bacterium]|nr:hypothetical protein [Ktedonobacteraceae bacterium]
MGWFLPVFPTSLPDQTQSGVSNHLSGYDIGKCSSSYLRVRFQRAALQLLS